MSEWEGERMNGFMLDSKDLFHKCESYRKNEKERDISAREERGGRKVHPARSKGQCQTSAQGLSRRTQI